MDESKKQRNSLEEELKSLGYEFLRISWEKESAGLMTYNYAMIPGELIPHRFIGTDLDISKCFAYYKKPY